MKNKILILFFVFLFVFSSFITVGAVSTSPRLVDKANILTISEETELLALLNEISERQQVDVVIVTVSSLNGKTPRAYADDFYDLYNYGFGAKKDGVLLLIAMESHDWYISTSGYGIKAFTDAGLEAMEKFFVSDLSKGEYVSAFTTYAEWCDNYITEAKNGTPYDVGHMPRGKYNFGKSILVSLVIGFAVAFITTGIMRAKLKTVRFKAGAADYLKKGSFELTRSNDIYLYKNVTRKVRPKNDSGGSSTHRSSSGRSHGGRGGKF